MFAELHEKDLLKLLPKLYEAFSKARPEDPDVKQNREEMVTRLEALKAASGGKTRVCLVCMTPRSGSTLLAEALRRTEKLGNPGEWFNVNPGNNIEKMIEKYGCQTREELLDAIYAHSATDNGVAIIKGDFNQCLPFIYDGLFQRHFDMVRFVQLTRQDVLAQGISRFIGFQTQSWSSLQKPKTDEVSYHREGIGKQVEFLLRMEASWKRFFGSHGIRFHAFTYEDLNKDLARKVAFIGRLMKEDVESDLSTDDLTLKKQGTSRNEDWAKQYAAESRREELAARKDIEKKVEKRMARLAAEAEAQAENTDASDDEESWELAEK